MEREWRDALLITEPSACSWTRSNSTGSWAEESGGVEGLGEEGREGRGGGGDEMFSMKGRERRRNEKKNKLMADDSVGDETRKR